MKHYKKHIVIVGGPNGAGKTTFANSFLKTNNFVYLSADDIAKQLKPEKVDDVKYEAGKEFFSRLEVCIAEEKNILIESTLSGKFLERLIVKLKKFKYEVSIVFVFVDSIELCINRIIERVKKGGHNIPEEDVRRRYTRSISNFWLIYKELSDDWYVYSNAGDSFIELAFGVEKEINIINEELFRIFVAHSSRK